MQVTISSAKIMMKCSTLGVTAIHCLCKRGIGFIEKMLQGCSSCCRFMVMTYQEGDDVSAGLDKLQ